MNAKRQFDPLQRIALGNYIYALRDPRDYKIFYVGQGVNDRVFDHFNEVNTRLLKGTPTTKWTNKQRKILEIWQSDSDVEWLIVAHNLPAGSSDYVEAAVHDSLIESLNGTLFNEVKPPKSTYLSQEEVEELGADFVNPEIAYKLVYIFSIQKGLAKGETPYDATRRAWQVGDTYRRYAPLNSYAVGLKEGISKTCYEFITWQLSGVGPRFEFESPGHPFPVEHQPLLNKKWDRVLSVAFRHWQWGRHLVVEFDGVGHFKVWKGADSQNAGIWHDCLPT